MHNGILQQVVNVPGLEPSDEVLDVTYYQTGTVENTSYQVNYNDLTAEQKQIVDDYVALVKSLAPTP